MGLGVGQGLKREGIYVYLWLIHVVVQQKLTQYCKVIVQCLVAQSCLTHHDPLDCSPLGSSDHGIFPARILEWVAISSSRGSSRPRDGTHISHVSCIGRQVLYHQCHLGSHLL